jgi:DNA-binding IclR family transcriptional regulator
MNWAAAGRKRFGLVEQLKPVLQAICETSGDTVYLTVRQGDEVVYIDRREGSYPLKALPVDVGARRPLGIGAAPMAILAFQKEDEIRRVVEAYGGDRLGFGIGRAKLQELIALAKQLGYALHQGEILPGMVAVGVPILDGDGVPFAAISVAAGAARLPHPRTDEIAALIKKEIADLHILPK